MSTDIARGFPDGEVRQADGMEGSSGIYEGEANVVLNFVFGDKGGETVGPCVGDAEALNAEEWDMLGGLGSGGDVF